MAKDLKTKPPVQFGEIGATGLPHYGGRIYDEPLSALSGDRWRKVVRDMSSNDASIKAILFVIEMIVRQAEWKIVPFTTTEKEDIENADFIRQCMFEDMTQTWQDTVAEIMSMTRWGWSYFELCYKRRNGKNADRALKSRYSDGKIGWSKWAIRSQESLYEWLFDESGEVTAMVQSPAPFFDYRVIPIEKALHFRTTSNKNNPEGESILRGAYRSWYFKSNIENIEGIGIERDLAGLPVVDMPPQYFSPDASAAEKELLAYMENLVTSVRRDEMEGIVIPCAYDDKGHRTMDFRLLSTGGQRQFDTSKIIDRYDQRMLMSVMADFMLLGTKSGGSYSLGENKWKAFLRAIKTWLDSIADTVNRHAIPSLLELNGKETDRAPYLQAGKLEDMDIKMLGEYVDILTRAGIPFTEEQSDYLKREAGIPVKDE